MEFPVMTLDINNEMDIMLAHKRGMQLAKFLGINLSEQTRFATAVSEICRNSLEYASKGSIQFLVLKASDRYSLSAIIRDSGNGIPDLENVLSRNPRDHRGRGLGLVFAKRLVDQFVINSTPKGTTVHLRQDLPPKNNAVINNLVVQGWVKQLQTEPAMSAYEELKWKNTQLLELSEELKVNAATVSTQIAEIRQLNEKLSKNNERLKEFTYAISHDLKTPLSTLKLASDYLQGNPSGEDVPAYQAILSRSVNRLDKTIHSLIEILDTQNQETHIVRELSFDEVLSELLEELEEKIQSTSAVIETDFAEVPRIRYIEGYLQSLLRNLLSNSLKYRDPERPLTIRAQTLRKGERVILSFADTGSGMDLTKIKERLFIPFTRFSTGSDGKGIGLYLVKSMVENNGGSVSVQSAPGEGTTFVFQLVPYR
jgi:signal transduction histidine kinase